MKMFEEKSKDDGRPRKFKLMPEKKIKYKKDIFISPDEDLDVEGWDWEYLRQWDKEIES